MIIDSHVHLPFNPRELEKSSPREFAERITSWMDRGGLGVSVLLPVAPYQPNDLIAKIVDCEPERIIGFASVVPNPYDYTVREVRRAVSDLGLKG